MNCRHWHYEFYNATVRCVRCNVISTLKRKTNSVWMLKGGSWRHRCLWHCPYLDMGCYNVRDRLHQQIHNENHEIMTTLILNFLNKKKKIRRNKNKRQGKIR